jgi:crotonobetainyl-CoA:carnitine CoA-transferase CaiB-like acyl-CoA transferase
MPTGGPLAGIRVVEMGGFSVAFAGRLLADAGADVVRLVGPAGDSLEAEPPFFAATRESIQAAWYDAGKTVIRAAAPSGLAPDILLDEGVLPDGVTARARVSITPFGLTGPRAGWQANDLVANAMSGSASVTGNAASGPITGYGNQTHHTVGLYAAISALAALRAARTTGQPQHADLSSHEALVTCTEQVLMEWFFPNGTWNTSIAPRQGSLHWSGAYEVYRGTDGRGVMVTAALKFADSLLPWLVEDGSAQDLANPEKYPNVISMVRDLPYVMKVLREWVAKHGGEEIFLEGQKRHQPFGVVWSIAEALERSPQIEARGYLQPVKVPGFGEVRFPGRLFRTSADEGHPVPHEEVDEFEWMPREERTLERQAATPSRPLDGIRVLDFTHVLAGPFGTRVLGDLGADIIKVSTGARSGGANSPEHPYYTMWNRNKRSVTINMASAEGRQFARRLAARCDVIIENFSAGVLSRWGLDRAGLHETNPGVTVISMGGMGQDGPWKDFVTFAPTIHALTGLTYLTNPPEEHLLGYGFSLTDHLSGLAGALAALEGVEHRDRTGEGLAIDLSQYELGLGLMGPALLDYLANGVNPEPVGNRHPFDAWAPHGIYRCAGDDHWVAIAARGDEQWRSLATLIGDGLGSDVQFATHAGRIEHQDALDAAISAWTGSRDANSIAEACQAAGIAAGTVQNAHDLTASDPQLAARGFFGTTVSAAMGEYGIDRFPALFNGQRPSVYDGPHGIGEDTFDVATELLGMEDRDVAELLGSGALS